MEVDVFDLVVRGRVALAGQEPAPAALALRDGRIAAVAERDAPLEAAAELDVGDELVLPGHVDVHVHTGSAAGEGIEAATSAAARAA